MALVTTLVALPLLLEEPTSDDAGAISLVGLSAVFSGLVFLCLFMILLGKLFDPKDGQEPDSADADPGSEPIEKASAKSAAPAEPVWEPSTDPAHVPMTLLASAVMAYHMHARGELTLGKEAVFHRDGTDRTVTLLSAGYCNRALVDGEEVVFNLSEVAPDDAVGRQITPAD